MQFGINYDNGYVVCVHMYDEKGICRRWYPLRNFGDHQGDARIFKEEDCPRLTDVQISLLVKNYRKDVIYKRINSRRFLVEHKN